MPRAAVAGAALVLALLATAGPVAAPVGADAISDKRAQAAAIQQQIDGMNAHIEALDEQYNQAQLRVEAATAAVAQAQSALAASDQRLGAAKTTLSAQAVAAYVTGTPSPGVAPAVSGINDLSVRKAYVKEMASRSVSAIEDLKTAKQDASDARIRVVAAQASAKGAVGQVATARTQVEQAIRAQQTTLSRVNGDLAQLIAEEQAREEAAAKAKAAAELAARQAEDARRLAALAASRKAAAATVTVTVPTVAVKPPAAPVPVLAPPPAAAKPAPVVPPSQTSTTPAGSSGPAASGASAAIAAARRQLGKPYQWAGAGPDSFDCSGLTSWAWRAAGVSLGHSTYAQWDETRHVALGDIQPGDLIFYGSDLHHVTMYTGGGMMIEAPFTGADVREVAVRYGGIAGIGRVAS